VIPSLFLGVLLNTSGAMLVLSYDDFGPQAMAHELLGMESHPWLDCHCDEKEAPPIEVVVYRRLSLATGRARRPVVPAQGLDRRYVTYKAAVRYLDRQLAELRDDPDLAALRGRLEATRALIIRRLGR
jgi:hypothetical protein